MKISIYKLNCAAVLICAISLLGLRSSNAESPVTSSASASQQAGAEICVMTCNLRTPKPVDDANGDGWAARKDFCIETIKKQNPDIIGFQECTKEQFDDLSAAFPGFITHSLNPDAALAENPFEVIFVSPRFKLVTEGGFWISDTPNVPGSKSWDNSKHPRVVNWMRLIEKASGIEFQVFNTHFDQKGQLAREHGAIMVVEAAQAFPPAFPQIFTGDLNAEVTNPAVAILKEGGWLDSYAQLHGPQDPGFTAHDFLGDKFTTGDHHGKIDWIFYRGDIEPRDTSIIRDSKSGHYPSDHYFVVANFRLKKATAPQ